MRTIRAAYNEAIRRNLVDRTYPDLSLAYWLFLFSYYARGMNYTDMAMLKWEDIYNG